MKNRVLPLILGAAILASIPFWNTEASAQPDPVSERPKPPIGRTVLVTLDPKSNSRSERSKEIRRDAGFSHHDTVEGTLLHMDAEWLVLKAGVDENWIPRDKVLLLHANP